MPPHGSTHNTHHHNTHHHADAPALSLASPSAPIFVLRCGGHTFKKTRRAGTGTLAIARTWGQSTQTSVFQGSTCLFLIPGDWHTRKRGGVCHTRKRSLLDFAWLPAPDCKGISSSAARKRNENCIVGRPPLPLAAATMYVSVCVCARARACVRACVRVCVRACVRAFIHTYIHT